MEEDLDKSFFGSPHPDAPEELERFAFLVGRWKCDVRTRDEGGNRIQLRATWTGRFILDGYVISDEFRMYDAEDTLVMLGINFRSYSRVEKRWLMKWLDAQTSVWLDLGPPELGGVLSSEDSITFQTLFRPNEIHRITFSEFTEDRFVWRADRSVDEGATWDEAVMVMEARRIDRP